MIYDITVIGGGPSGATAAEQLAKKGFKVALIDRAGRIKPCGGAIPPRLIEDFEIPQSQLVAKIKTASQMFTLLLYLLGLATSKMIIIIF